MTKKYRLTDRGLTVSGTLSYDEWREIGARLEQHRSGVQWAIGDWLRAMPRTQSWEQTYADAQILVPYRWETLRAHHKTAEAFAPDQRAIGLSWSFYKVSIPLRANQRMPALRKALEEGITYTEFVAWVEGRMDNLPTTRMLNPSARASAGRVGRPRRNAGAVTCPQCGHAFRVVLDQAPAAKSAA